MSGKARRQDQIKGVFCLEADQWYGQKDRSSVEPMLRMLEGVKGLKIPYEHRTIATIEELGHCLNRYLQPVYKTHPLLYLAFHGGGAEGDLKSGIELSAGDWVELPKLAELMKDRCTNRIIHFGSCSVMSTNKRHLNTFLRETRALAVCGYREDVDWILAAAFELILLATIQSYSFRQRDSAPRFRRFDDSLKAAAPGLYRDLGFRLVTRPD